MTRNRRKRRAGQSIVEFALIMPLLLAFFGVSLDMARVFQAWITLEGATRDAAEIAATQSVTSAGALTLARSTVCKQTAGLAGYVPSGSVCTQPNVTLTSYSLSTTAVGATAKYPIATVTVSTSMPFTALFSYPLVTQNGAWQIRSSATYAIVQGR